MDSIGLHLPQRYQGFHIRPSDGYCIISNDNWQQALKVMREKGLKKLEISPNFINFSKNEDLSFLGEFSFVEGLNIIVSNLNHTFPLADFVNLRELLMEYNKDIVVDYSRFSELRRCMIDWRMENSETIANSENLTDLRIDNYKPYDLKEISSLKSLKKLKFVDGRMYSADFIEDLGKLECLQIYLCKNLSSLNAISKLKNLEEICFEYCGKISSIEPISEIKNLKKLIYCRNGTLDTVEYMYTLTHLEELNFYGTEIFDGKLHALKYLFENHKLKKINFKNKRNYSHTREELGFIPFNLK